MGEIGQPEGGTQHSGYAEERYEKHRNGGGSLSASELTVVRLGYLREWVCMGECNLRLAGAQDPGVKEAIRLYLKDVCSPNFEELKKILEDGGYDLPAKVEDVKSPDESAKEHVDVTDDRTILLHSWFGTQAFMNLWNTSAALSQRTDVRDAFLRNYHRANRWHMAFYDLAIEKGYLEQLPSIPPMEAMMHKAAQAVGVEGR